jgi:hypothetical protein
MAGEVVNIKVCSPLKLRSGLIGKYHAICHYSYNLPLPPMQKDRRHRKTMTKNGLDIQTIATKRTDIQTDRILLLGQVTEKQVKADLSHFLKFLFTSLTNGTFGFARHKSQSFAKPKEPFFCNRTDNNDDIHTMKHKTKNSPNCVIGYCLY